MPRIWDNLGDQICSTNKTSFSSCYLYVLNKKLNEMSCQRCGRVSILHIIGSIINIKDFI